MRRLLQPLVRPIGLLALACALVLSGTAQGEGQLAVNSQRASAALDFQIIIPPVLMLQENSLALSPPPADGQPQTARQTLTVLSNLKRGFCLGLTSAGHTPDNWQVTATGTPTQTLEATAQGYRLCLRQIGRLPITLDHVFQPTAGAGPASAWPVQLSLVSL